MKTVEEKRKAQKPEIKLNVTYSEECEQRFTMAILKLYEKREKRLQMEEAAKVI